MAVKKITWSSEGIRNMCIAHSYYTRGTNDQYEKMLEFVRTHCPMKANVYKVAKEVIRSEEARGGNEND